MPLAADCATIGPEATIRRILLIHWDVPEAEARVARLQAMGYSASFQNRTGPALLRTIRDDPPSAVLIDLSRLPSQGRDVAVELRVNKVTRQIPIVFVDGLPEKVLVVRQTLPDATYSTWTHLKEDLERAISRPPRAVMVPDSVPAGYAGKSTAAKLGIQPNTTVVVLSAPADFASALEPLPKGVTVRTQLGEAADLIIWFVRARRELNQGIALRAGRVGDGRIWIAWPKKTSGQSGDLTQASVREAGLAHGLVDTKLASIDENWSGLLFTARKPPTP